MYRVMYFPSAKASAHDLPAGAADWIMQYPPPPETSRRFHESHAPRRIAHSQQQLESIAAKRPQRGRLLEVGAGRGEFLTLARSDGWEVHGIEPSNAAVSYAKQQYDLELDEGTLEEYDREERFDVVYLSHVFEHVLDASATLSKVGDLLAADGLLVIEVPNQFESWVGRCAGVVGRRRERSIYSIHHTLFFGPRQLEHLLARHGFHVDITTHFACDFDHSPKDQVLGLIDAVGARIASQGRVLYAEATRT